MSGISSVAQAKLAFPELDWQTDYEGSDSKVASALLNFETVAARRLIAIEGEHTTAGRWHALEEGGPMLQFGAIVMCLAGNVAGINPDDQGDTLEPGRDIDVPADAEYYFYTPDGFALFIVVELTPATVTM